MKLLTLPGLRGLLRRRAHTRARSTLQVEPLEGRALPSVTIQIDYTYDTSSFFTAHPDRMAAMQAAADDIASHLNDNLSAITPGGSNSWTASFFNPSNPNGADIEIVDLVVPANKIIIYVGAANLSGSTIGLGGPGSYSGSGSGSWLATLAARGQSGSDFGPWGGSISFDRFAEWYFDLDPSDIGGVELDFINVARHEIAHVLGFGTADSWHDHVSGANFTGPVSEARYGGPVPLDGFGFNAGHWDDGVLDQGQATSMDPVAEGGERTIFTPLDYAGFDDMGWDVSLHPSILGVTSTAANGTYTVGQNVTITVVFDENVTVTGNPQLTLETGASDAIATYASGSGSQVLVFTYTVAAGNNSADLDVASSAALSLNGGSIRGADSTNALLTLPNPSAANSMSALKSIVIDTSAPTVTNVTSLLANGSYTVGQVIPIRVVFSTSVTVTGTPQLSLNTGAVVNYSSGSGSNTLTFNYTVGAGQTSADLDYTSTTALSVNGGTIRNSINTDATLTLFAPGSPGSLGANKNLVIDTTAPAVTNVTSPNSNGIYSTGQILSITVAFGESVLVTGIPQLALSTGATASYSSGSGTSTLTFSYTIASGQASSDLDYASTGALTLNGGTIRDPAGNNAVLTLFAPGSPGSLGANKNLVIDTTIAAVTSVSSSVANGTYGPGQLIPIVVTFNNPVFVTGTPQITLETGASNAVASYVSGSGSAQLVFNYTVASGQQSGDLDYVSSSSLTLNGGTIVSASMVPAVLTLPLPGTANSLAANKNIVIDAVAPSVTINQAVGQADPTTSGPILFTVIFSKSVTGFATGDVTISGTAGATTATVTGSGANYTVSVSGMTQNGTVIVSVNAGVAVDGLGNSNAASTSTDNSVFFGTTVQSLQAAGTDFGFPTLVHVFQNGAQIATITPYAPGFLGGVRVATGDVNGDGVPDIMTAAGPGAGPHVKVFDGVTFQEIASFYAFQGPTPGMTFEQAPYFDSGMFAAMGDVNGDSIADLIVGADVGGRSHFKVFSFNNGNPGEIVSQFAFDTGFNGGVRVGAADVDGDGDAEVLIAAGPGAGPNVKVFRYNGTSGMDQILSDWAFQPPTPGLSYEQAPYFDSGMYIAGANVDDSPGAELIVGAGQGGGSHIRIFKVNGGALQEIDSFFAYAAGFNGGVRVAASDFNQDGIVDILAASGPGLSAQVKVFQFLADHQRQELGQIAPFTNYSGGVFIGG